MARSKKAAKGTVKVNFKGVESRRTPPEGDYPCRVLEATQGVSSNKNEQIEFVGEISKGEYKGVKVYLQCPLLENSLWKLHAFLTALGVDVPEDELDIDLSELVGEEFMGVITHETYNGKKKAKLTDFDTIDNYSGSDDDDDDKKGKKKAGKKDKAGKDDDDKKSSKDKKGGKKKEPEKVKKADVEDMDRDDLEELIEEHGLDVDADDKKLKKDDKLLAAVLEALEEEGLLEEEKKSKKGDDKKSSSKKDDKKGGKKKAKKLDRSDVEDMDEEELEELIEEHDLDVDLDDYKKLPKKVAAVIDALEEADLLDD